ncbi:hypothetical protein PI124_g4535 [Phytophthora idaei]|nr:hypothetical protein PI125_g3186 [Phytophthora idaei]KAG3250790.1 hypothetical protein PI124_g4535 [Phytophthora idaei]
MHCDVEDQRLKQRLLNKKPERGENFVNFAVGDYVLRSRFDKRQGNKLQATWVGPYRVVRPDTHSFTVERLVTGELTDGHASRLKMYAGDSLEVTEELLEYVSSQGIVLAVNELKDHRWNTSIEDYEPLEVRVLIDNYVTKTDDSDLNEYWKQLQGVSVETTAVPVSLSSQSSSISRPRASTDTVEPAPSRKRRRQTVRGTDGGDSRGSTKNNHAVPARVAPSARSQPARRTTGEDSQ